MRMRALKGEERKRNYPYGLVHETTDYVTPSLVPLAFRRIYSDVAAI